MGDTSINKFSLLTSDRQLLPQTGTSRARDSQNGEYLSRGSAGPWQCDVDVTTDSGIVPKLYQVGPTVAELRPMGAGLDAANKPCFCVFDADGIAQLPGAGDPPDGICVAEESQGGKTWGRVVLMNDGLLYVLCTGVALASGATVKTDANGQAVVAAAGDQAAGVTVRACSANKIAAIRGARGKIA